MPTVNGRKNSAHQAELSNISVKIHARKIYRDELPVLSTRQNILAFIACVAEGVLIEAINESTATKLIYATQAALGALPREPKTRAAKQ